MTGSMPTGRIEEALKLIKKNDQKLTDIMPNMLEISGLKHRRDNQR